MTLVAGWVRTRAAVGRYEFPYFQGCPYAPVSLPSHLPAQPFDPRTFHPMTPPRPETPQRSVQGLACR
jgi:hypothetical protein